MNFEGQRLITTGSRNEDPTRIRIDEQIQGDTAPQSSALLTDRTLLQQQRQWPHHNWTQQTVYRSELASRLSPTVLAEKS